MKPTEADVPAQILDLFRKYGELEGGLSRTFHQVSSLTKVFSILDYRPGDEINVNGVAKTLGIPEEKLLSLLDQKSAPVKIQEQGSPRKRVFRVPDAPVEFEAVDAADESSTQWWKKSFQNAPKGRYQPPDDPSPRWS